MAGKMTGVKGLAASRMAKESKASEKAPSTPHRNPRSAHVREANGGYIMSAHGGDDPMGSDHVAPDIASLMAKLTMHMGGVEEGASDMPKESAKEEVAEMKPAPKKKSPPSKSKKKPKIKLRDKSETY